MSIRADSWLAIRTTLPNPLSSFFNPDNLYYQDFIPSKKQALENITSPGEYRTMCLLSGRSAFVPFRIMAGVCLVSWLCFLFAEFVSCK